MISNKSSINIFKVFKYIQKIASTKGRICKYFNITNLTLCRRINEKEMSIRRKILKYLNKNSENSSKIKEGKLLNYV